MEKNNLSTIAIIGRPNVGKSSLFNRLIEQRFSIVSSHEGTTRDNVYGIGNWRNLSFRVIDTGGMNRDRKQFLQKEIDQQIEFALDYAQIILFMISRKEGLLEDDVYVWKHLKKRISGQRKLFLIINKCDTVDDFKIYGREYNLTTDEIFPISSIHGLGFTNLLDKIVINLREQEKPKESDYQKIAIIGKPNVGKSTLLNQLLQENRSIVTELPGTTRDIVEGVIENRGKNYQLLDTAGLKRKKRKLTDLEWYAELRTQLAIEEADIILFLLDVDQGLTRSDFKIMQKLLFAKKPFMILANKIDTFAKGGRVGFEKELRIQLNFINWIKVVFISALNRRNLSNIFDEIEKINARLLQKISIEKLNTFIHEIQIIKKIPSFQGRNVKIAFANYIPEPTPLFLFFANYPQAVPKTYQRFLEKQLRQIFDFENIPLKIIYKRK